MRDVVSIRVELVLRDVLAHIPRAQTLPLPSLDRHFCFFLPLSSFSVPSLLPASFVSPFSPSHSLFLLLSSRGILSETRNSQSFSLHLSFSFSLSCFFILLPLFPFLSLLPSSLPLTFFSPSFFSPFFFLRFSPDSVSPIYSFHFLFSSLLFSLLFLSFSLSAFFCVSSPSPYCFCKTGATLFSSSLLPPLSFLSFLLFSLPSFLPSFLSSLLSSLFSFIAFSFIVFSLLVFASFFSLPFLFRPNHSHSFLFVTGFTRSILLTPSYSFSSINVWGHSHKRPAFLYVQKIGNIGRCKLYEFPYP